jgi:Zn finger protein HypA/HybF involved in hydrogenase expression
MIYEIPVEWSMFGVIRIEAESVSEAIEKAKRRAEFCALPDGTLIDGSFKIMNDSIQQLDNLCQCGSCEKTFKKSQLKENSCPHCGSGNWVYGYIDEDDIKRCNICGFEHTQEDKYDHEPDYDYGCDLCKKCGTNNCGNDTEHYSCFERKI